MFFDDPVAAFRNIRPSLKADGSLHFVLLDRDNAKRVYS